MAEKLAVVTCHFNWAGFDRPAQNLKRFVRQMKRDGIPVYGIELYLKGRTPSMLDDPNWRVYQVEPSAVLWQKEALLNKAETFVPKEYDAIATIDADVFFERKDWVPATLEALAVHPLIQPFKRALWTDRRGNISLERIAVADCGLCMKTWKGHPGFAWVFRRDFYRAIGGWYDAAPMGSGDLVLSIAACHNVTSGAMWDRINSDIGPANSTRFLEWVEKLRREMGSSTAGYIPGALTHEFHGKLEDRRYGERAKWMADFDVSRDLDRHIAGYWNWSDAADPKKMARMAEYFQQRKED